MKQQFSNSPKPLQIGRWTWQKDTPCAAMTWFSWRQHANSMRCSLLKEGNALMAQITLETVWNDIATLTPEDKLPLFQRLKPEMMRYVQRRGPIPPSGQIKRLADANTFLSRGNVRLQDACTLLQGTFLYPPEKVLGQRHCGYKNVPGTMPPADLCKRSNVSIGSSTV